MQQPTLVCVDPSCAPTMFSCKDDDPPTELGKSTQRAKCNWFRKYIHHNTIVCMLRGSCDLGPFATALPGLAPDGIGTVAYLQYTRALNWLFEMWYGPEITAGALPLASQQNMSPNEALHTSWGSFMNPGITGSPCVSLVKILFTTSNKKWSFLDNHYLLGLWSRDCKHNFVQFTDHLKNTIVELFTSTYSLFVYYTSVSSGRSCCRHDQVWDTHPGHASPTHKHLYFVDKQILVGKGVHFEE